ncbi:DNA (cytosine-5-)-methyltransferase [Clostridium perfringens]|uniref:DNA (cytosine-5-)-methyltransferase n=3 Tax=Clostridium perfringens TaxID=1502 RepID=UPI0010F38977|nr:DNA (cytosine-5-)-methyltransferase [Clostridium perfringens]NGT86657.1 DNA (cytosine-5-)-methyltransferase [Clostridium perfringens]VTQ59603.1 DNA-cytosine methyltransferase [Clostridium perfringens]
MSIEKTVCELFAGVGGFHVGLSNSNKDWNIVFANQWEPSRTRQDAFNCYRTNFPNVYAENVDIKYINDNYEEFNIPNYNLLVGGFPCQDYSVASTGAKGIQGKKGVLWWEIRRMIERDNPPFVLLENVDRLLKSPASQRGRDFAIMLACFRDLGYCVEWRVINAADYGFPQKRVRIFIFAYKNNTNYYESQVNLINSIGNEKYINKGFFAKQFAISGFNDIREYILNEDILTISNGRSFQFFNSGYMIGNKIITQKYIPKIEELSTLESILEDDVDDIYYLGENLEDWKYMKGAKAIPRTSRTGHEYVFREGALSFPDILNKPARTMLTSESSKNRSTHVIRDPQTSRLRVLTPIECERLNGFPDNWTNTGMSEKFRYFCMGNALVVGLIERMGKTLSEIFENEAGERLLEILDND